MAERVPTNSHGRPTRDVVYVATSGHVVAVDSGGTGLGAPLRCRALKENKLAAYYGPLIRLDCMKYGTT